MQRHEPFRDELAGALGRIEQLETENRILRERLESPGPHRAETAEATLALWGSPSRHARAAFLLPLVTSWGLLMTAALVRFAAHGVDTDDRRSAGEMYIRCGGVAIEEAIPKASERPLWSTSAHARASDPSSNF